MSATLTTVRRLPALLTVSALVAAGLALTPAAAYAADAPCTPPPATAVVDKLGIDQLQASGLDGAGLTIGVISTSYSATTKPTSAAEDVASGALPGAANPCGHTQEVKVIQDGSSDDEGRAMLQIVHAIAPAADLVFTTAVATSDDPTLVDDDMALAKAVNDMANAGVDVIVDDIMAPADLAYASGFAASAAKAATDAGILYVVAAGNLNHVGAGSIFGVPLASAGYSIGSWQTTEFRGTDCPAKVAEKRPGVELECMDFDPTAEIDNTDEFTLYAEPGVTDTSEGAVLQWAEAPFATTSKLFAAFLDENGEVADLVEPDKYSVGLPLAIDEVFGGLPLNVTLTRSLVIAREKTDSAAPLPVRFAFFDDDMPRTVLGAEYFQSTDTDTIGSMIIGRGANPGSVTVAATSLLDTAELQPYSAGGPQVRYFGDVTDKGVAPARLATPEVREGPTVTGVDDIPTTFFGQLVDGTYYYPGTSAATPVVGTVMALARQAAPYATNEQLKDALTSTATPYTFTWNGSTPAQTSGAGLIDPVAYLAAVRALPAPSPTPTPSADGTDPAELAATGAAPAAAGLTGLALLVLGAAAATAVTLRRRHTR